MSSSSMSRKWLQCAAAACLALSAGFANAGAFVTRWDPIFNLDFSTSVGDLGWRGEAVVSVDDGCVSQTSSTSYSTPLFNITPGCNSANIDTLDLTFYDVSAGTNIVPTFHLVDPNTEILAIESASGAVSGMLTYPWLKFDDVLVYGKNYDFWLAFTFDGPILVAQQDCYSSHSYMSTMSSSKMKCDRTLYVSADPNDPDAIENGTAPNVSWARVPEPGSLGLLGLALCAAGVVARRRKNAA